MVSAKTEVTRILDSDKLGPQVDDKTFIGASDAQRRFNGTKCSKTAAHSDEYLCPINLHYRT